MNDDLAWREQAIAEARAAGLHITTVYHWQNDMIMVFDQRGEQMPAYQGHATDVLPLIRRDAPDVAIKRGDWRDLQ